MKIKSVIFCVATTFFCFPVVGTEVQAQDPLALVAELRSFQKVSVVIPALEFQNDEVYNDPYKIEQLSEERFIPK